MTKLRKLNGVAVAWDGRELEFTMSMNGLSDLASCFREFACGVPNLGVALEVGEASPNAIEVRQGEERLKASLENGRVVFAGNNKSMALLADNMEALLSLWIAGGRQHFHFDPSSDQLLLEPDSEAFIFSPRDHLN